MDKDKKNKKKNWKTVNFDFASLYSDTFRVNGFENILRKISIRKIWKKDEKTN